MNRGKLAIISGPSGAGKDTLINKFLQKHSDWINPPSTTTREPREGETAGIDMGFVSLDTFLQWQKEGKFLESFQVYKGIWYGTLAEPVERLRSKGTNVLLRIDVQGALDVKQKVPEAITIMIKPESSEVLEQRIRMRNSETPERINERLDVSKKELSLADKFDHVVVNATDLQERALEEIEDILL